MQTLLKPFLSALTGFIANLFAEELVKELILIGLEALAKRTDTKFDDQAVEAIREHMD